MFQHWLKLMNLKVADMDEVFHRIKEDYEAHGHKEEIKKQEEDSFNLGYDY
mgnify:CR=1 FL=1